VKENRQPSRIASLRGPFWIVIGSQFTPAEKSVIEGPIYEEDILDLIIEGRLKPSSLITDDPERDRFRCGDVVWIQKLFDQQGSGDLPTDYLPSFAIFVGCLGLPTALSGLIGAAYAISTLPRERTPSFRVFLLVLLALHTVSLAAHCALFFRVGWARAIALGYWSIMVFGSLLLLIGAPQQGPHMPLDRNPVVLVFIAVLSSVCLYCLRRPDVASAFGKSAGDKAGVKESLKSGLYPGPLSR
jgi:hypothetical protein